MKHAFLALSFLTLAGCALGPPRVADTPSADPNAGYFDYAGTYTTALEGTVGDETYTDEFDVLIQQNGPAASLAGILGVVDAEGISFGHTATTMDYWLSEVKEITYSGSSRSGEPYVIDLTIAVVYPYLDGWDITYEYVLTLGAEVDYSE